MRWTSSRTPHKPFVVVLATIPQISLHRYSFLIVPPGRRCSTELLALGRILDRIFPHYARRVDELITTATLKPGLIVDLLADAYMTGQRTAWTVHGAYLRAPRRIPAAKAREWRGKALEHGQFITRKFTESVGARVDPSVAWAQQYARVATEQTVWTGQDAGTDDLARFSDVQWKEWVRAWPRRVHRDHHDALEGIVIPFDDLFTLPGGPHAGTRVHGPRDWENAPGAGEHLNCGHALKLHQSITRDQLTRALKGRGTIYTPPTRSRIYAT